MVRKSYNYQLGERPVTREQRVVLNAEGTWYLTRAEGKLLEHRDGKVTPLKSHAAHRMFAMLLGEDE